jgi:hypothetical protein
VTAPKLVEPFAVTNRRNNIRDALATHGEECVLLQTWHPSDKDAPACRTCGGDDVYHSAGFFNTMSGVCPECFGTTYSGGVRDARRVWAMFSDHVASEDYGKRGVWAGDAREIQCEPFPLLTEHDYVVRVKYWSADHRVNEVDGYYAVQAVTRDSLRTGNRFGQSKWDVIGQRAQISRLQQAVPINNYPIQGVQFLAPTPQPVTSIYQPPVVEPDTKVVFVPLVEPDVPPTSPQDPFTGPGLDWEQVYTHVQDTPAATWTIPNPFPYDPTVTLIIDGEECDTDVLYPPDAPDGFVVLIFPSPQSGTVKLA